MTHLGRIEEVSARTVWAHEAQDFTPWVEANADLLSDVLGIEVSLDAREYPVGAFSLDILGRDLTNDCPLIIENQLEPTDHNHLGQLITYAAGTDAKTVVWIATKFREEHRQAIDYLNDISDETTRFFGLEIRIVRINDSAPAPLFQFAAKPNDWHRAVAVSARETSAPSERMLAYRSFWQRYIDELHARHPGWSNVRAPQAQSWLNVQYLVGGKITFAMAFGRGDLVRAEVYIDVRDGERNLAIFNALKDQREAIETEVGTPLVWEDLPESRACRIAAVRPGVITNLAELDEYMEFMLQMHGRFRATFNGRIEALTGN